MCVRDLHESADGPGTLAERKALAAVVRDQAGLRLHQSARDRDMSYDDIIAEYAAEGEAQELGGFDYFTKQPDCIDWTKCPEHVDVRALCAYLK